MSLDSKLAMPPAAPLESARVLILASPATEGASGSFPRRLSLFHQGAKTPSPHNVPREVAIAASYSLPSSSPGQRWIQDV